MPLPTLIYRIRSPTLDTSTLLITRTPISTALKDYLCVPMGGMYTENAATDVGYVFVHRLHFSMERQSRVQSRSLATGCHKKSSPKGLFCNPESHDLPFRSWSGNKGGQNKTNVVQRVCDATHWTFSTSDYRNS